MHVLLCILGLFLGNSHDFIMSFIRVLDFEIRRIESLLFRFSQSHSKERLSIQHVFNTVVGEINAYLECVCNGIQGRETWSEDGQENVDSCTKRCNPDSNQKENNQPDDAPN